MIIKYEDNKIIRKREKIAEETNREQATSIAFMKIDLSGSSYEKYGSYKVFKYSIIALRSFEESPSPK